MALDEFGSGYLEGAELDPGSVPVESADYSEEEINDEPSEEYEEEEDGNDEDVSDIPDDDEDASEDTLETEDDEDAWVYPDFIPDDLVVPDSFESPAEELDWYKENYFKAIDSYKSDEFRKTVVENYSNFLLEQETEVSKLKALKEAFDGNPRGLFKHYFGTDLESAGVQFKLSKEEINDMVVQRLSDEFGDDYYKAYDVEQVDNPRSMSYRMIKRQEAIMQELEQELTPKEPDYESLIEESYSKEFSDFDRKEYDEFIQTAKDYKMSMRDVYNAINFKTLHEQAYEDGVKAAKEAIAKEMRPQSKRVRRVPTYKQNEENSRQRPLDQFATNFFK